MRPYQFSDDRPLQFKLTIPSGCAERNRNNQKHSSDRLFLFGIDDCND